MSIRLEERAKDTPRPVKGSTHTSVGGFPTTFTKSGGRVPNIVRNLTRGDKTVKSYECSPSRYPLDWGFRIQGPVRDSGIGKVGGLSQQRSL